MSTEELKEYKSIVPEQIYFSLIFYIVAISLFYFFLMQLISYDYFMYYDSFFPASLLGNGQMLNAGVYSIGAATTLNLDLTLNGQGNPSVE